MKNIFILLIALFATKNTTAQWISQLSGNSFAELKSVYFINENIGYAVGYNTIGYSGVLLKTTDGGANWITQWSSPAPGTQLIKVFFTDTNTGYIVGQVNSIKVILKTTDGGTNWSSQTTGDILYSLYFIDANTGYAVGVGGKILKTTDAGTTWITQTSPTSFTLLSVFFIDANTGYATGREMGTGTNNGPIIKTTNGGTNWTSIGFSGNGEFSSLYFTDANTGYVVGDNAVILKTTNGGTNWTAQTSGITNILKSVYFTDVNTGYIVGGNGTILKTTNGGNSWFSQISNTTYNLSSVCFANANTGYIVGGTTVYPTNYNIILKTTNSGGPSGIEGFEKNNNITIYPNPVNDKIEITELDNGMIEIINIQGQIVKTLNTSNTKTTIDLSKLSSGVYTMRIKTDDGIMIKKIIKQ